MFTSGLQLTSEKERSVARLVEERERAERDQSAALAEAVKGQATLRAEMAAILQRAKVWIISPFFVKSLRCVFKIARQTKLCI